MGEQASHDELADLPDAVHAVSAALSRELAVIVASRRGVTARVNDNDRWVADAIIADGWTKL